jgi:hypothetical protein
MSGGIFITYRRDDASIARRLYDRLSEHFPQDKVLMDVDRVVLGEDLVKTIEETIGSSDVLIAVIGKGWVIGCLESRDDYVRLELAVAFKRNIGVIAVLVEGASMPRFEDLPDDLKALARLNALQIGDTGFDADYNRLVTAIEKKQLVMLLRAAEAGNAIAMANLGRLYENGWGLAQDYGKAREWYQKAAASGKTLAMTSLSGLYLEGQGVAQDYAQAREWWQRAAASILASGNFPKETEHRAVAGKPERSPVDCTVFAPDRVERKQTRLLQVFLHAPEARRQAEAAARKFDPEAKERGHRSLVLDAPIGTTFAFDVEIEGFVFPERTDTLLWSGQPQAVTFRFDVSKGCKLGQHAGTVRISQDGAPVGKITFQIEVVHDARDACERPVGKEARHYHACFCSYSSRDRAEMLKRAQGLRATGLETFIDVLKLRPGDIWNPKIFRAIDESDLFVVIWSKNASDSEWVKKESRYALRRYKQHGSPDFVPIPVEGPPIASVPRGLQARHFNDELLGQIRAAELEMRARKKKKSWKKP